jgi:molecular chaperone GrpE (heat shock protein)
MFSQAPKAEQSRQRAHASAISRSVHHVDAKVPESEAKLRSEFTAYRRRVEEDLERARARGRDEATTALFDIVDDCDRALTHITQTNDVSSGVEQLRARALRHFEKLGYQPYGEVGEVFNPTLHEAVAVEAVEGVEGSILRVHRRGWKRDDDIVRPTVVTVIKGQVLEEEVVEKVVEEAVEDAVEDAPRVRRRHRRVSAEEYVCPYAIVGCQQDCPGCRPLGPEFDFVDENNEELSL